MPTKKVKTLKKQKTSKITKELAVKSDNVHPKTTENGVTKTEADKNALVIYDQLSPLGSIEAYLSTIQNFRVLDAEEENKLSNAFRNEGDLEAARLLVLSNLRFVAHISRGYKGYGLPITDIIQEGNIGLMKAVRKFDPAFGVRLISFAVHWIRAEIQQYIIQNWKIVKLTTTKAQRKLFFNLRNRKEGLDLLQPEEVKAIAEELNVKIGDVVEMEKRLAPNVQVSYDSMELNESGVAVKDEVSKGLGNPAIEIETKEWDQYRNIKLEENLSQLDQRTQEIIRARWMHSKRATLEDLASRYDISAERVRQIEAAALKKLRDSLKGLKNSDD